MKSGIKIPAFACSTFVAATPQGQRLFGRNFDLTDSPAMLLVTRPPQGYASLSLVNLSFLGFDQERGLPGGLLGRMSLLPEKVDYFVVRSALVGILRPFFCLRLPMRWVQFL